MFWKVINFIVKVAEVVLPYVASAKLKKEKKIVETLIDGVNRYSQSHGSKEIKRFFATQLSKKLGEALHKRIKKFENK